MNSTLRSSVEMGMAAFDSRPRSSLKAYTGHKTCGRKLPTSAEYCSMDGRPSYDSGEKGREILLDSVLRIAFYPYFIPACDLSSPRLSNPISYRNLEGSLGQPL